MNNHKGTESTERRQRRQSSDLAISVSGFSSVCPLCLCGSCLCCPTRRSPISTPPARSAAPRSKSPLPGRSTPPRRSGRAARACRSRPRRRKGKFKVAVAKDAVPGVYWLRAYNAEGASGLRPFLVGTLPEVMEKEPNDEPRKPQAAGRLIGCRQRQAREERRRRLLRGEA